MEYSLYTPLIHLWTKTRLNESSFLDRNICLEEELQKTSGGKDLLGYEEYGERE